MRDWLGGALAAARLVAHRSDLWPAGALIALASVGWAVFLAVVAPSPDEGDVAYLGVSVLGSPFWPWNGVVLLAAILSGIATLLLLVAYGEVWLMAALSGGHADGGHASVGRAMAVLGLAATPIAALTGLLGWAAVPAFIDAYTHPDPATPYLLRVVALAWPALLVLAPTAVLAQALGAAALRGTWQDAVATVRRRGHRIVSLAAVTFTVFISAQLGTVVALRLLWAPLDARLSGENLAEPSTAILLLGFVWIWLLLVILAGVVQAWISAWWSRELEPRVGG